MPISDHSQVLGSVCMAPEKLDEYHQHTIDAQGVPSGLRPGLNWLVLGGAATCSEGFVICFLKVPLA